MVPVGLKGFILAIT